MLDKWQLINDLLDWYGVLLTAKQRAIMQQHYRQDLSLAEIAEQSATSRSAVHDLIKRSEQTLQQYEDKLHLLENFKKRSTIYEELLTVDDPTVQQNVKVLMAIDTDTEEKEDIECQKSCQ